MQRSKEMIVYVAGFTGPLAGNLVLSLLGVLGDAWDVDPVEILLSIPAFMFPFAIMQLFSGTISDAYNRGPRCSSGLGCTQRAPPWPPSRARLSSSWSPG